METDNAAVLQVLLSHVKRLEHAVLVQGATIDHLGAVVEEAVSRLEESVDVALRNLSTQDEETPY